MPVPIGGLAYSTPTQSGTTNLAGEFQYEVGETVEFSLGASPIGFATGNAELTLFDLQRAAAITDVRTIVKEMNDPDSSFTRTLNIIRILYSLDDDLDTENGINIATEVNEVLNFHSVPRRFAYSQGVDNLLAPLDRKLMPLEISLAHQYRMAGLQLIEDGVVLSRRTRDVATEWGGDVFLDRELASYQYDDFGSLKQQDSFDDQGQLAASTVSEFRDDGLRFRRTFDNDADGVIDVTTEAMHNTAGDVVNLQQNSVTGTFPGSLIITHYDAEGRIFEITTDRGSDGSVDSRSTIMRFPDTRTERIEVSSELDADTAYVITNTYDDNALLSERLFEGIGIDIHEFLDDRPPPLAVGSVDPFDPLHPYWGLEAVFFAAGPDDVRRRHTRYHRDSQGRVIGRSTDTNSDDVPDQIARLDYEDGRPVAWFYDREGDGDWESTAAYHYGDNGELETTEQQRFTERGLAMEARTVTLNDNGLRRRIDTVANGIESVSSEQVFDYDDERVLTRTRIQGDSIIGELQTDWEQSYRLDDSALYSLTPENLGPYQYEFRDIGEPEIRDADGNLIASLRDEDDVDISLHFEGVTTTYTARLILLRLSVSPPGFDIVYQEPRESCAANEATIPLAEANEDGSRPTRAYYRLDDNRMYIPDPTRKAISARIGSVYNARSQNCTVARQGEVGLFYPLMPTDLVIRYPLMIEGVEGLVEPDLGLID